MESTPKEHTPRSDRKGGRRRTKLRKHYLVELALSDFSFPKFRLPSYHATATLIGRAQGGCIASRNRFWQEHLRLVRAVVNKIHLPLDHIPDAWQEGAMGLRRAIEKYQFERGHEFSTYAWYWISQAIRRYREDRAYGVRIPAKLVKELLRCFRDGHACETDDEQIALLRSHDHPDPKTSAHVRSLYRISRPVELTRRHVDVRSVSDKPDGPFGAGVDQEKLHAFLRAALLEREWYVIVRRFGLDGEPEATLETIGELMKLTRERIRQIEAKALDKLREKMITVGMDAFLRDNF